jgi:hypothetical protein
VSQVAEVEAIQEQPDADSVIATEPPPPAGGSSGFTAEREKLQAAPACEIMKGWPPTSTFAVRVATVEFGLMTKLTVPKPDPVAPLVTLIHDGPGSVLHEHPPGVIMFTDAVPPVAGMDAPEADRAKVHPLPAWLTASGCPAIVGEVDRLVELGFALTSITTAPDPFPVEAVPTVANPEPVAVQTHVGPDELIVTMLPGAAAAPTVRDVGEMVNEHAEPNCVSE